MLGKRFEVSRKKTYVVYLKKAKIIRSTNHFVPLRLKVDENRLYYSSLIIHIETTIEIDRLSRKIYLTIKANLSKYDHLMNIFHSIEGEIVRE